MRCECATLELAKRSASPARRVRVTTRSMRLFGTTTAKTRLPFTLECAVVGMPSCRRSGSGEGTASGALAASSSAKRHGALLSTSRVYSQPRSAHEGLSAWL